VLARTVVIVAFVVALASALLHATALLARARVHRVAVAAVATSFDVALAMTQAQLAGAIASGGDPRNLTLAMPSPKPSCASVRPDGTCALTIALTLASSATQTVGAAESNDCTPQCASNLQGNDAVDEGRFALHISASAAGPNGTVFATRDRYAIFRTTRLAPYASLIGTRDASGESIAGGTSEGEDAGAPALTTVNVRYVDAATGASMEGNAWQSRGWANADASGTAWEP
jgi:hypothetical protein